MKRYAFYMLIMAVAAVVACQKTSVVEEEIPENQTVVETPEEQTGTYVYTINASIPETKSDYDNSGNFSWSAGDAISVLFHKDDDNQFFTLDRVSGTGANATFSGTITAGYTVGASDGTSSDKKIWALFPASTSHTYTAGELPKFYVQPSVDFSASYFSANVPMYALNAAEGTLTFTNLASTYKFTVNNIKAGVDKVRFTVYNQITRGLSGLWGIYEDAGDIFINYEYADPGSAKSTLSYVSSVTDNKAVFYVSYHCKWGTFMPVITVSNEATGVAIKTFTANTGIAPNPVNQIKPVTLNVSEASGGVYYTPAVLINGDFTDWDGVTEWDGTRNNGGSNSRINHWRMQADAMNVYVYLDLNSEKITNARYIYVGFDTDSKKDTGDTHGNCPGCEQYVVIYPGVSGSEPLEMIQGIDPRSEVNGSSDGSLTTWCNLDTPNSLLELCIPRSKVGLSSSATIKVSVSYDNYDTAQQSLVLP